MYCIFIHMVIHPWNWHKYSSTNFQYKCKFVILKIRLNYIKICIREKRMYSLCCWFKRYVCWGTGWITPDVNLVSQRGIPHSNTHTISVSSISLFTLRNVKLVPTTAIIDRLNNFANFLLKGFWYTKHGIYFTFFMFTFRGIHLEFNVSLKNCFFLFCFLRQTSPLITMVE